MLYKLTNENGYTRFGEPNECHWGENVKHTALRSAPEGVKPKLCSAQLIHAYESPLMAVVMNPRHAVIKNPILWTAKGWVVARNGQFKCGCVSLTTLKQIPLPVISTTARTHFAILCALEVCKEPSFVTWAKSWLLGKDRNRTADAYAAAAAAYAADAAYAAAATATAAAEAAAYAAAAYAAAAYAAAAYANAAANAAAAYADAAAAYAADAAAYAADVAAYSADTKPINFVKLLKKAIKAESEN